MACVAVPQKAVLPCPGGAHPGGQLALAPTVSTGRVHPSSPQQHLVQHCGLAVTNASLASSPATSDASSDDAAAKFKDWQMRRAMLGRPMKFPLTVMMGAANLAAGNASPFPSASSQGDSSALNLMAENLRLHQLLESQSRRMEQLSKELTEARGSQARLKEENFTLRAELKQLQEDLSQARTIRSSPVSAPQSAREVPSSARKVRAEVESKNAENASLRRQRDELQHVLRLTKRKSGSSQPVLPMQPIEEQRSSFERRVATKSSSVDAVHASSTSTSSIASSRRSLHTGDARAAVAQPALAASQPWLPAAAAAGKLHGQVKDEIDERLVEYLESSRCPLHFKRVNRGWYQFWSMGKAGQRRHVELSLVNGKLVARSEASMQEEAWNCGKPGAIERFALAVAATA
mmetsp:Transcript_41892/g.98200  ORF Transcript_41892/g.98200 Transcript_41892/m.98200 type:complete len:405 (-) Transcript_41892:25-1239(-)